MLVGNRLVRIIFGTFVLLILVVNLVWWVSPRSATALVGYDPKIVDDTIGHSYKGFNWFFAQLGQFPGFDPFIKTFTEFADIVGSEFQSGDFFQQVLAFLRIMVTPVKIIEAIIKTIFENFIWIGKFIGALIIPN